ncbi:MAG: hypothetical protein IPH95_07050 [Candidatus Promineofilum sp.]|nr:hypothetical protein [Promineifilum sp.]
MQRVVPQFGIGDGDAVAVGLRQAAAQREAKERIEQNGPGGHGQTGVGGLVEPTRRRADVVAPGAPRAQPDEHGRCHGQLILPHPAAVRGAELKSSREKSHWKIIAVCDRMSSE